MSSTTLIGPSCFVLPPALRSKALSQASFRSISGEGHAALSTHSSISDRFHKRAAPKPVSSELNNYFKVPHPVIKQRNLFRHVLLSPLPPQELAELLSVFKQLIGRDDHLKQKNSLPALKEMMIQARPVLEALQSQPDHAKLVIYQKGKNGKFIIEKELYKPESCSQSNSLIRQISNFMVASGLKLGTQHPLKEPQRFIESVNRHIEDSVGEIFNPEQNHIKKLATAILADVAKTKSEKLSEDLLSEFLIPEREYLAPVSNRLNYDLNQTKQLKEFVNQVIELFRSIDENARPLLKNSGNPQMRYRLGVAVADPASKEVVIHSLNLEEPH